MRQLDYRVIGETLPSSAEVAHLPLCIPCQSANPRNGPVHLPPLKSRDTRASNCAQLVPAFALPRPCVWDRRRESRSQSGGRRALPKLLAVAGKRRYRHIQDRIRRSTLGTPMKARSFRYERAHALSETSRLPCADAHLAVDGIGATRIGRARLAIMKSDHDSLCWSGVKVATRRPCV